MSKDSNKQKDWEKIKGQCDLVEEECAKTEVNYEDDSSTEGHATASKKDAALDHPSYAALEEKLTLAEQKAHENWEKAVRAMAELDNGRRRAEREVANVHRYGLEKIIYSFLPVLDSLEQALQLAVNDANMHKGLELTQKLFIDALSKHGVVEISPQNATFNPQEHEAMAMQDAVDVKPNTVLTVFQKGYKLHDRVIRPARVIVAKAKTT